jgi:hypothetical protein
MHSLVQETEHNREIKSKARTRGREKVDEEINTRREGGKK